MKYKLVVSGGTFDRFHKGHEAFLSHQLAVSEKVLLGITSDAFAGEKDKEIEPFSVRRQSVERFLTSQNALSRVRIVPIEDGGIPQEFMAMLIEAIVVTEATRAGAEYVNKDRAQRQLSELAVEVTPLVNADDKKPISSTRIRAGEINREGTVYFSSEMTKSTFMLPDSLRGTFKEPFGLVIKNNEYDYALSLMERVVTVGDIATKTFVDRGLFPRIAMIDFVVERQKQYESPSDIGFPEDIHVMHAENPAGTITPSLANAVSTAFADKAAGKVVIAVKGEEDLAVLPVLLVSPLGYEVYYGQPGEGLVKVLVTEEKKAHAHTLMKKLTRGGN